MKHNPDAGVPGQASEDDLLVGDRTRGAPECDLGKPGSVCGYPGCLVDRLVARLLGWCCCSHEATWSNALVARLDMEPSCSC